MSRYNHHREISWGTRLALLAVAVGTIAALSALMPRGDSGGLEYSVGKPWRDAAIIAKETFPMLKSDSLLAAERQRALRAYRPVYELATTGRADDTLLVVTAADMDQLARDGVQSVTVSVGNQGRSVAVSQLHTPKTAYKLTGQTRTANLTLNRERSEQLRRSAINSVSRYKGEIQAGQEIVRPGQIVDQATALALQSMESYQRGTHKRSAAESACAVAGHTLYICVVVLCLFTYFLLFRSDYFGRRRTMAFVTALTVFFPILVYGLSPIEAGQGITLLVPCCMTPIFVRVFMDSRTAFIMHTSCVMLAAVATPFPFEYVVTQTLAGLTAIYSIRHMTQRSELFVSAIMVTATGLITWLGFDLANGAFFTSQGAEVSPYLYITGSGLLLLMSYLLLVPFEKMFRFTSNVTLVELSNTNNEVLRRLSEEAPGTFQHSMQVANLASEVALKIGAKSQLVRTGALYHDIGKLHNPALFTENQKGYNPHDNLPHAESARIIIDHVRHGLALADKHRLPRVVRDFISTHHGRGQARYFLIAHRNEHPGEEIDEAPFTYPGPDPTTAEQAILMMADAVEAASRSLTEYTDQNINTLVDGIVDGQLLGGHFDACPITLEEVSVAKQVFKDKLKTIYHTRIAYPTLAQ